MPPIEKRRRKKARIQDQDSSSSSDSDAVSDVEMQANEASSPSELSDVGEDEDLKIPVHDSEAEETPRERLRKTPLNQDPQEFNQAFLKLVTDQFGEDLAALRQANDFGPASLSQLIAGLKQGIDIFTPEQQRMI